LLIDNGLDAVWIETYGGTHYLRSMPNSCNLQSEHISIPQDKEDLLKKIWKQAKTTACFDVLAWDHNDNIIFLEAKHFKKDKLTQPQLKFIKGAIDCGISPDNLLIVEWGEDFQYKTDYDFFLDKLADGDNHLFEAKFLKMFDFRNPSIKRKEFNQIRNKVFKELSEKYGEKCQLNLCKDCCKEKSFEVDHFIPLSTNELNKKLRGMKAEKGKKVPSQSFGSNDISNLRIACKKCNAFKKHRIIL